MKGSRSYLSDEVVRAKSIVIMSKEMNSKFVSVIGYLKFRILLLGVLWFSMKDMLNQTHKCESENLGLDGVIISLVSLIYVLIFVYVLAIAMGVSKLLVTIILFVNVYPISTLMRLFGSVITQIGLMGKDNVIVNMYGMKNKERIKIY